MHFIIRILVILLPVLTVRVKNHVSQVRHCDICGLTFKTIVDYEGHLAGKKHAATIAANLDSTGLWVEMNANVPHWAKGCTEADIEKPFNIDEISTLGLQFRSTCLHPSMKLLSLSGQQKGRIWRYVREAMGYSHYKELATIIAHVELFDNGHTRVKELFESIEAYKFISNFIIAAQRTRSSCGQPPLDNIVEMACGHGLVGLLLAYRFPSMKIRLFDLKRRPVYDVLVTCWQRYGEIFPGCSSPLENIEFFESDISEAVVWVNNSVVVCLHGCNEVNEISVDMAEKSGNSAWVAMPCCVRKDQYLGPAAKVSVDDDNTRYHILCGAFANTYDAQVVGSIDSRITNRQIIMAGGVKHVDEGVGILQNTGNDYVATATNLNRVSKRPRVIKMTKLLFS
jgi:hypothetical protein